MKHRTSNWDRSMKKLPVGSIDPTLSEKWKNLNICFSVQNILETSAHTYTDNNGKTNKQISKQTPNKDNNNKTT